jgi:hypothetical protein
VLFTFLEVWGATWFIFVLNSKDKIKINK